MRRTACLALGIAVATASGQIALKPSGRDAIRLTPRTVDVRATIRGGVADETWTYAFANAERFRGQADFLVTVPEGGVVHGFAYWYHGERVVARVTEKERARRIYQAIVDRQRDPALIEMVGRRTFRVRIFPIDEGADLKVELRLAQALPATRDGTTLSVPLRSLGKVESATVEVTGDRKLQGSWGPVGTTLRYRIKNSVAQDLRASEAWAPRALHASLRAARSGGDGGFFALTLTPSRPLAHARWRLEGDVADVGEWRGKNGSVALVGRYLHPGPLRAWLVGDGYRASADLTMSDTVEPNGPAAKLWAWDRIGRLRDRKAIVALSLRHTVPSPYTSWIAIPTEERKRMAREIARAELTNEVAKAIPTLRRVGIGSARGRAIVAALDRRAASLGVSRNELWDEKLNEDLDALALRWEASMARVGEDAPATRRLLREIQAYQAIGVQTYRVTGYYDRLGYELAPEVFHDRLDHRKDAAAIRRAGSLRHAARLAGHPDVSNYMEQVAGRESREAARRIAEAERGSGPTANDRARLTRVADAAGYSETRLLREARVDLASDRYGTALSAFAREVERPDPDVARMKALAETFRREQATIRANGGQTYEERGLLAARARRFTEAVVAGKAEGRDQPKVQAEIDRIAQATGVGNDAEWTSAWSQAWWPVWQDVQYQRGQARRNRPALAKAEAVAARVRPFLDAQTARMLERESPPDTRQRYLDARRRGESGEAILQQLYGEDAVGKNIERGWTERSDASRRIWAADRSERLRALTELDRLDEQRPDPQVQARVRELERRAEELRARMGDPIVAVEAPGARSVVARMPDGAWLPMHRVAGGDRWEGRFDVPAGVADGRYEIGVYVDGERRATVPIHVDTAPPTVTARWEGDRAEVRTEADVKRVAGFTPEGGRIELDREAPGRFAGRVPVGTRFVATDGAHNRSDLPAGPLGEKGGWTGSVSALAFVGDHLWVGTENDGGGFAGEPADAAHPWIKAAVVAGGRLAVREADGTVRWGDETLRLPRRSTSLGADGADLLVGTIGGWFEVGAGSVSRVFPDALAGYVVTAILRDGSRTWVGTQGRGLAEVGADGIVTWHDERRGLADDWITCLGRDEAGRVVAGTFVGGAWAFDGGLWRLVPGTRGTCVTGVAGPWTATRQGLVRGGAVVSGEEATALAVRDGEVWIGTRAGAKRIRD